MRHCNDMVYWNISMKLCNKISVLLWSSYVTNIENTVYLISNLFGIYQNKNKDVITAWSFIYILGKTNWCNIYLIIIAWSCKQGSHSTWKTWNQPWKCGWPPWNMLSMKNISGLIMSTCFAKKLCLLTFVLAPSIRV